MKELVINKGLLETRIAYLENGEIVDLIIENKKRQSLVGNVYKGKVKRVLPGMNASFVDIGQEKAAFLYAGDIVLPGQEYEIDLENPSSEEQEDSSDLVGRRSINNSKNIDDLIKEGQEILVQIVKDPISTKGARLTTFIAFAGQFLVFMPYYSTVGVSRKIIDEEERLRLKEGLKKICPSGVGLIARTASENVSMKRLKEDYELLAKTWKEIQRKVEKAKTPSLIHEELDIVQRSLRDFYGEDLQNVVIDERKTYKSLVKFASKLSGKLRNNVNLYAQPDPLFEHYGIEMEINRAMDRKVWLKSGGYIIVDQTEALVAIDVNTGKFVGKRNLEETILKTNLEAVKEIAYQLKLRNIGGIIVIDFIDMDKPANREKVVLALEDALKKDKARTNVSAVSEFGLVEMTRKRTGDSLWRSSTRACPYCDGRGAILNIPTILTQIYRDIRKEASVSSKPIILLYVPDEIAEIMVEEEKENIASLESVLKKRIVVKADPRYHLEDYEVLSSEE